MGLYGFVWYSYFWLEQIGGDMVEFLFEVDEVIYVVYFFDFQLCIGYCVQDWMLICCVVVSNLDSVLMFFQFGFYLVFVWFLLGMVGQLYGVELENGGVFVMMCFNVDGLIVFMFYLIFFDKGVLVLDQVLFQDGVMVFFEGVGDVVCFGSVIMYVWMCSCNLL